MRFTQSLVLIAGTILLFLIPNGNDLDFQFPWDEGDSWYFTGAPHCENDSGLDFSSGKRNGEVRAVAEGRVTKIQPISVGWCGKSVTIEHEGGWQTRYCHLDRIDSSLRIGDIEANDKIGIEGQTGGDFGNHLHLQLFLDGNPHSWDDLEIGGWTIHDSENDGAVCQIPYDYNGYLLRSNKKIDANDPPGRDQLVKNEKVKSNDKPEDRIEIESGNVQGCSHLRASGNASCYIADESFLAIEVDFSGFSPREQLTVTYDYPCTKESFSALTNGQEIRPQANGSSYWSFRNDYLGGCGNGWYTQSIKGNSSGHISWIRFYWGE